MNDFKEHLERVQVDLLEEMARAIEKGFLREEELPKIGEFVSSKIDNINNRYELDVFLTDLSSKWPIFKNIDKIHEGKTRRLEDKEEEESIVTLIKHGKIGKALRLAKYATKR